ncbi:MAG TPA: type II secretion system protein GspL [Burkholderiales bacterium]|nr:type II secretion system protein GspL [Burkholderiales bacterium]
MARRGSDRVLQIHLSERFGDLLALEGVPVRWTVRTPRRVVSGVGSLAKLAPAGEVIVVLPVGRVGFVRAQLPAGPPAKLAKLAPFAIEDLIVSAPEDIHAAVLDDVHDGARLLAVLDREWLTSAVRVLEEAGFAPDRAIVESALVDGEPGIWTVIWSGRGGFAVPGGIEAIMLDRSVDGRPPLALNLAANERRARGAGPRAVRVLLADEDDSVDVAKWSEALHVPVTVDGRWEPEKIDARTVACPDLLPGAFGGTWTSSEWLSRLKPAAILAGVIVGLNVLLTVGDWARLAYEAHGLRSGMESAFRKAFPDAKSVVDPALQMRRNFADLRRAAGEADASDLVPMLAKLAPALAAIGAKPQSLRFDRGEIELDLALGTGEPRGREELVNRLRVPGLSVRVERVAAGAAGPLATVRVAPEA